MHWQADPRHAKGQRMCWGDTRLSGRCAQPSCGVGELTLAERNVGPGWPLVKENSTSQVPCS